MALIKQENSTSVHKVKGPLRCHTCRLMCRDAEHYLSHTCAPRLTEASRNAAATKSTAMY